MLELEEIGYHKFYNLSQDGWRIDYTKESIKNNNNILQSIASDFSQETGIEYALIMNVFGKKIIGKSYETLLLMYTNVNYTKVHYKLTHYFSDIWKMFEG